MIHSIIFDIGGVLIDLDLPRCRKEFLERLEFNGIDELLDACHQKGFYSDMEEGKISEYEFRVKVLASSKKGAVPEDVDASMLAMLDGIEKKKVSFLKELYAKGYELYLLSNNNPISMKACIHIMEEAGIEIEKIFKDKFISYEMKMLKPSPAIYEETLRRIGRPASEIMFIDDSMANIEAASLLGFKAFYYKPGTSLENLVNNALAKETEESDG